MSLAPIGGGLLAALSLVLAVTGASKLRAGSAPTATLTALRIPHARLVAWSIGPAELGAAAAGLFGPPIVAGPVLALTFAGLGVAAGVLRRQHVPCGCFGASDGEAPGALHVAANVAAATMAAGAALTAHWSLGGVVWHRPGEVAVVLGSALAGWGLVRAGRTVPRAAGGSPSVRLVESSAALLERRFSRRSALLRVAVVGSAFCVAPLRYLLYPESALAVISPGRCGGGLCADGYTAFCCEINKGQNACPEGTFVGGWWMCTDYRGHKLCAGQNVRYYVDCNRRPGHHFPGGCHCANGTCKHRRVNCNVFRYGQCNTHIAGTTEVVCRMVTCQNPGSIASLNCSTVARVDNATCGHEAPCLREPAVALAGAGGV